jgi:hypothetical protein
MFSLGKSTQSVADLLGTSITHTQRLGQSGARSVYALGEGLESYALCIESHAKPSSFKKSLLRSTSLHSPEQLATGLSVGQPLLHSHPSSPIVFSIHRREMGVPLKALILESNNHPAQAAMPVMRALLERAGAGENPLQRTIDDCYRLWRDGREPDLHAGNMLFDAEEKTIRLVDQVDRVRPALGHEEAVKALAESASWLEQSLTQKNEHAVLRARQPTPDGYDAALPRIRAVIE